MKLVKQIGGTSGRRDIKRKKASKQANGKEGKSFPELFSVKTQ
jgi:hypothetical protein